MTHRAETAWWADYISIPALCWVALWFGINTGPWVLRTAPTGPIGWLHYLRTLGPLFLLFTPLLVGRGRAPRSSLPGPVRMWIAFGLVSLVACVMSPHRINAAYWALCYLAVFAVLSTYLQGVDQVRRAVRLNDLSWFMTTLFLAVMLFVARDALFVDQRAGLSGYGVVGRVGNIAGGIPMSRSSGMARFAAVPGIVAFVLLWTESGARRLLWAALFISSGAIIYLMQSRGAAIGFGFALAFATLFLGRRARYVGLVLVVLCGVVQLGGILPEEKVQRTLDHLSRGESVEEMAALTGRTRAWNLAWNEVVKSPLFGWGPQSDRYLIGEHVHNAYLYALLQSGFLGVAAFVAGLAWAWVQFVRAVRTRAADRLGQRAILIQVGAILAFFTVRSIPEASGAFYGVDLLVLLPALTYVGVLDRANAVSVRRP